jgi:DNA-binding MarR family transcriptional regulator
LAARRLAATLPLFRNWGFALDRIDLNVSPNDRDPLAARPGFLIRRMHQIHLALFAEECAAFDITPVQYSIMTVVAVQPGLDQATLAHEVGVDRATLANVVARLEKKLMLKRIAGASDKRLKLVYLVPRGTKMLEKMQASARRAHERTVEALPPAERTIFMMLLSRLVDAQNDFGRAPLRLG